MAEFWSIKEAASYLGVGYKTVYRLVRDGEIPAGKVGGVYRIRKEDVDVYFERQKQEVLEEETEFTDDVKCVVCLRLLSAPSDIGGECADGSCASPICKSCWQSQGIQFCPEHRPSRQERLDKARRWLAAGEIDLLVTTPEAKQRELSYIRRFDQKVRGISKIRHPVQESLIEAPVSWSTVHTALDESDWLLDLLGTGYLEQETEQEMPLNPVSRYSLPARVPGGTGLVLEARVISHLPSLVRLGFDTRPASLAQLLRILESCTEAAESQEAAYVLGIASTTGWDPAARAYVHDRDSSGRSFSHRLVIPFVVDLHEMTVVYDEADHRTAQLASLVAPRLAQEEVQRAIDHIGRSLLTSHGVGIQEIAEESGISEEYVRAAFGRLVEEETHRLEDVRDVGEVLMRVQP